jgi:hypothetical protein
MRKSINEPGPIPASCFAAGSIGSPSKDRKRKAKGKRKRKGRLGQIPEVAGSCDAFFNHTGTEGAGILQLYRQCGQLPNNVPRESKLAVVFLIATCEHKNPFRHE